MAGKLKDDQIKWILTVDAQGAQGEIQKLVSSSEKLKDANKQMNLEMKAAEAQMKTAAKEMANLEKAGQTTSEKYKEVKGTFEGAKGEIAYNTTKIAANTKEIDANNKAIDTTIKEMKLEEMTMGQLKNRAASLQKQLSNTSKSANPEEYKKLEKELDDVKKQMGALGERSKNLCDTLNTMRGVILANIATKIGEKIQEWAKAAWEFTKEGVKMAASAQGVQAAFDRIADKDYLKSLRKDTKGLVNDFDLMKAAVKADNFNIPLNQLGKLLQFAQQRAKDTGESVDYLVDTIVNGIGRKSPLIIDNLGISVVKLNAEVKKTGDFAEAVAKIVEEEMGKVGKSMDTVAETATQKAVALENFQLALGKRFLGMQEAWDKMITGLVQGLTKLVEVEKSHKEQYEDQIKKVADLEVNTGNLVQRYKELKSRATLSKEEQVELNKIINSLRSTVPGIVTEFDKYGNALSINTQKVWDFIAAQKEMLSVKHEKAIKEQTKNLEDYRDKLSRLEKQQTSGTRIVMQQTSNFGTFTSYEVQLTGEELTKLENEISKYKKLILGTQSWIDEMNGTTIENQLKSQKEIVENRNKFNDMTKKQLEDYIKINKDATDKYIDIAQEVYRDRFKTTDGGSGSGNKKELNEQKKIAEEQKKIIEDMAVQMEIATKSYNDKLKSEGIFQVELTKLTQEQLNKRLQLDKEYQDKLNVIALKGEETRFKNAKKTAGVDGDSSKFTEQQNKVLEILQQQHEANIQKIKDNGGKSRIDIQKTIDLAILDSLQRSHQSQLDVISATEKAKIIFLQSEVSDGIKTRKQYQKEVEKIESDSLASRIVEQEKYIETLKALTNPSDEQQKDLKSAEQSLLDLQIQANNAKLNQQSEFEEKKKSIREEYGLISISEQYAAELELLKQAREEGLLSEEEYEQAKLQIKLKYAQEYAQKAAEFASMASDAISALQSAEIANTEAKYDAEIAAAGDNTAEVERLENEKAKKKLDIEKKYADVQFAVTAAEIVANTAMAIMQAYSQLGPIAGTVAAVLMGITGAAQLAVANSQRKKVKQMSLSGTSSTGEAPKTGQIKLKEGFVEGGSNTGDHTDGGYTGNGNRYDVAGWVPYHNKEYFVAVPEMKDPVVQDHVRAIDKIRRKRTNKNPLPKGFADGGSNTDSSSEFGNNSSNFQNSSINKLTSILEKLDKDGVKANIGVTELEAKQTEKIEAESNFTLDE
jgi:hypothetical protein